MQRGRTAMEGKMDLGLRGRKALVTGASKGIGRATAEILAEEGCDVVLVSRSEADLAAAADAIRAKHNVRVEAVPADLSVSGNVSRLVCATETASCASRWSSGTVLMSRGRVARKESANDALRSAAEGKLTSTTFRSSKDTSRA